MTDYGSILGGRIVNTITAGPLLNLLLAMDGMEEPADPRRAWAVFKRFAQVPSSSTQDVLGFQVRWIQVGDGYPVLTCAWVRQLTDDAGYTTEITRIISLEYSYDSGRQELTSYPEDLELWSDDYSTLSEFFGDVEQQPQFSFMLQHAADFSGVYLHDEEDTVDE